MDQICSNLRSPQHLMRPETVAAVGQEPLLEDLEHLDRWNRDAFAQSLD